MPSSGLSVRTIADVLRDFFNIRERKVGGAITIVRPEGPDRPAVYKVALDLGPSAALSATPEIDTDIEKAIRRSARSIAREYDPVGLASYYVNHDRKALKALADDLMKSADRGHRRAGLFVRGLNEANTAEKMARFREAIAEDPKFGAAYNALGSTLADMNDGQTADENEKRIDEAIRMFGEAIRLNPSNAWAFRNRADVHRAQGLLPSRGRGFRARPASSRRSRRSFLNSVYAYEY